MLRRNKVKENPIIVETSSGSVDGYIIEEYLGVTTTEIVIGTGPFSELFSKISDFFGRRSNSFESKLEKGRKDAMETIAKKAASVNANGIIGMDVDIAAYEKNRTAMMVTGTLVKLKKYPVVDVQMKTLETLQEILLCLKSGGGMQGTVIEQDSDAQTQVHQDHEPSIFSNARGEEPKVDLSETELPDELVLQQQLTSAFMGPK